MIQEIYDYLWIRKYLMSVDIDTILENIKKEDNYEEIVTIISKLMQKEDFLLTYQYLQEKVRTIINENRFNYNQNKDINDEMNYIIYRLNTYRNMSDENKLRLINSFYEEEWKNRNLPLIYKPAINYLDNFIAADSECFVKVFFEYTDKEKQETVYDTTELMPVCATSNLLANEYPEFYYNEEARDVMYETISAFRTFTKLPMLAKKYINKTEKNVKKIGAR